MKKFPAGVEVIGGNVETQAFANAIMLAIGTVARDRQGAIHLDCVISALTGVLGHHIAGIDDPQRRAGCYAAIGGALYEAITDALQTPGAKALVVDNSRPPN